MTSSYDQIVEENPLAILFEYDIAGELSKLTGVPLERHADASQEYDTVFISFHGSPESGFAIRVLSLDVENDAPRILFTTRQEAKEEASRLYERRRSVQYLELLQDAKCSRALEKMKGIDQANLAPAQRKDHQKRLREDAAENAEVFRTQQRPS